MTKDDLANKCAVNAVAWAEVTHDGQAGYYLRWDDPRSDTPADKPDIFIATEALAQQNWPTVYRSVVQGRDVRQVTRVCGYFSATENWNASKIGELADRHRGDYSLGRT